MACASAHRHRLLEFGRAAVFAQVGIDRPAVAGRQLAFCHIILTLRLSHDRSDQGSSDAAAFEGFMARHASGCFSGLIQVQSHGIKLEVELRPVL